MSLGNNEKVKKITGAFFKTTARKYLIVLSVALIGIWALIFVRADTQYNVRFVLFCTETCNGSASQLDGYANEIQNFYSSQLGGKTFNKLPTIQVQGSQASSYYGNSGGYGATNNTYYNLESEPNLQPYMSDHTKIVVMLGFKSMANCGVGTANLAVYDPFTNGCPASPALAHELGHDFLSDVAGSYDPLGDGSNHTHDSTNSLMNSPKACTPYGASGFKQLSECSINPNHKNDLQKDPWLVPPPPSNPAPEGSIYTSDDDSAAYACQYQSGWAVDRSDVNQQIAVHVYINGTQDGVADGTLLQGISANQKQGDQNFSNIYGTSDNHGWVWTIPDSLKDGVPHNVEFFVIDYPTGSAGNHSIGVRTINCAAPSSGTVGSGTGLTGVYYDNMDFTGYKFNRTDARIFNDWGNSSPDSRIAADTFSVKWLGQVQAQYTGTYTFYTTNDNGARLYVNNQLMNTSSYQDGLGPTDYSGSISLTAGQKYDIRMEYYEDTGGALAKLNWAGPNTARQEIPTSQLYPYSGDVVPTGPPTNLRTNGSSTSSSIPLAWTAPSGETPARYQLFRDGSMLNSNVTSTSYNDTGLAASTSHNYYVRAVDAAGNFSDNSNTLSASTQAAASGGGTTGSGTGLLGVYYDNMDFSGYKFSRVDSTVNFNYGSGSPDSRIGVDTFSMSWLGQVQAQDSGSYTFYVKADDGVRLYVGGKLLIDKFIDQGATEYASSAITLSAGQKLNIRMEYYENGYDASAQLSWAGPNIAKQVIPASQLYPTPPSGTKQIIGLQSPNRCLDLRAGQLSNAVIQLYDCASGNNNQLWSLQAQSDGRYVIKSAVNTGYCLDVPSDSADNGTGVWVYSCNGSEAQRWAFVGSTIRSGRGKCLDARGPSDDNGTVIQIWDCTGPNQTNQLWR